MVKINKDQPIQVSETNLTKEKLMSYLKDDNPHNRTKYFLDGNHDELIGRRDPYKINYNLKQGIFLLLIPSFLVHIGTSNTKEKLKTFKPVIENFVWALYESGMRFLHYRKGRGQAKEVIEEMLPSDNSLINNILNHLNTTCNPKKQKIGDEWVKPESLKFCNDPTDSRFGLIGEIRGVQASDCIIEFRLWLVSKIGEKLGDPNFGLELVYEDYEESHMEELCDGDITDSNNSRVKFDTPAGKVEISDNEMEDSNKRKVRFYAPGGKVEITWDEHEANLHAAVDQLHTITIYLNGLHSQTKCTIKLDEPIREQLKSYIGTRVFRMRDLLLSLPKKTLLEHHSDMIKRGVANGVLVMANDGRTPEGDECLLVQNNVEGNRPELKMNYYNDNETKAFHSSSIQFQIFSSLLHPEQDVLHRYAGQSWATPRSASHTCKRKSCIGSHICAESLSENVEREQCYGWIYDNGVLKPHLGCKHSPRCVNILYLHQ